MLVTISRQLGSAGDFIAARVAAELGLTLIDRDTISTMALNAGVSLDLVRKLLYEGRRSLAHDVVDALGKTAAGTPGSNQPPQSPLGSVFAPLFGPEQVSQEDAAGRLGAAIRNAAVNNDILVVGRGGQVLLRDYPGVCHVQIIAPPEMRAQRVAAREGVSLRTAQRRVKISDQARSEYLARFHNANWLDPLLYHIVINTGQSPVEVAVLLIVTAARELDRIGRNA